MQGASPTPVVRRSLVESTIDAIRELIDKRTWRVGESIPKEAELAEHFGVGRNTVREAVRVLSHSGMLEVCLGELLGTRRGRSEWAKRLGAVSWE